MWGQGDADDELIKRKRIIPTRVGTSYVRICCQRTKKDHPHACGDKWKLLMPCLAYLGSSPRVWGQATSEISPLSVFGIIPTRVGTSSSDKQNSRSKRDHPHACGDKSMTVAEIVPYTGSSPRVWGQGLIA